MPGTTFRSLVLSFSMLAIITALPPMALAQDKEGTTTAAPASQEPPCEEDCPPPLYGVGVLGGAQITQQTNTTGHSAEFEVENIGTATATIVLTCEPVSANVTCTSVSPSSVVLTSFHSANVTAYYNVGAIGNGTLRIKATIPSRTSAVGSHTIIVQGPPVPPPASLLNANHDNVDRSLCLTAGAGEGAAFQCGGLLVAHGLPPYPTMGRDRSPTLIYTSDQAFPKPTVQALVTLGGSVPVPQSVYAKLEVDINGTGTYVYRRSATWQPWGTSTTAATRVISLVYDGSNEPTGAHPYRMTIRSNYASGPQETVLSGKLLIVNRRASPFGEGWGLAGVEQILIQSDNSMLWWGGDGSSKLYQWVGSSTWVAPTGSYRDTLRYSPPPVNEYYRVLRHGITVTYNAAGRHVRTTNRTGQVTTFTWNTSGQLTGITVPPAGTTGTTYTVQYNATTGMVNRIADPANRALWLTHTGTKLTSIIDPDTVTTWYQYLANGNMQRQLPRKRLTQTTGWTNYSYLLGVRLTRVAIPIGPVGGTDSSVTVFEPWDERTTVTEGSSNNVAVHPDSIFTRIRGPRVNVADDAKFYVNRWGAPDSVVDPLSNKTRYARLDPRVPALVTQVTYPNNRVVRMIYDSLVRGNLIEMRDSTSHLPNGSPTRVSRWHYTSPDAPFSPSQHIDASGASTGYAYTAQGLPWRVTQANGLVTRFEFKTGTFAGLVQGVVDEAVPTWDTASTTEQTVNLRTGFSFNALGNVISDTSAQLRVRRLTRDVRQLVTDVYDAVGHRTSYLYDGFGRVRQAQEHVNLSNPGFPGDSGFASGLTTRTRRTVDVVDSIMDPRNVPRSFRYDEANRLIGEFDEVNVLQTSYLDAAGLVDSVLRRTGKVVRHTYDAGGRLTRSTWEAVDGAAANAVDYTYNNTGQMLSAQTAGGNVSRVYAPTGDLLSETTVTGTITYGYDPGGRRAWHRIGPANDIAHSDSIWYNYDAAGQLRTIGVRWRKPGSGYPAQQDSVMFAWDKLGRRDTLYYSNGALVKYAYDADGTLRLMCSTHPDPSNNNAFKLSLYNEIVDHDGMIRRTRSRVTPSSGPLPAGCLSSGELRVENDNVYGARHQLIEQQAFTTLHKYRYDGSGNMTKSEEGTYKKTFVMPLKSNRLSNYSIKRVVDSIVFQKAVNYKSDGSRSNDLVCSGAPAPCQPNRAYLYDGLGRTVGTLETTCTMTAPSGECVGIGLTSSSSDCLYDGTGRMYRPCENGAPFLGFDGDNVVRTDNEMAHGWTIVHGPGLDDPLMAYAPGFGVTFAFFLTDGAGRQYAVANRSGADLAENEHYLKGGKYAGGTGNSESFGADRHSSTSIPMISFFRNRLYDQATGRWTQEDPIGVAGGVNLYQFNGNNPVSYTDPFGHCPKRGLVKVFLCNAIEASTTMLGSVAGFGLGGGGGLLASAPSAGLAAPVTVPAGAVAGGALGAATGKLAGAAITGLLFADKPDKDKEAGQQYEEIEERQRRLRSQGRGGKIESIKKSKQRDRQELIDEAEDFLRGGED